MNTKYTKISEVNLSAFIYRLFHEDFSSIVRISIVPEHVEQVIHGIQIA